MEAGEIHCPRVARHMAEAADARHPGLNRDPIVRCDAASAREVDLGVDLVAHGA